MGQLLTEHVKFDVQQTMCIVVVTLGGGVNEVWISLDKKSCVQHGIACVLQHCMRMLFDVVSN